MSLTNDKTSTFDNLDIPDKKIIDDCVHCGFCLSSCPTYLQTGNELESPRGRIYLINSVLEGNIGLEKSFVEHVDLCLGCLACETACPSGVKYRSLIEYSRSQIERNYRRSLKERFTTYVIFKIFPHPNRLKWFVPLIYIYNKLRIRDAILNIKFLHKK